MECAVHSVMAKYKWFVLVLLNLNVYVYVQNFCNKNRIKPFECILSIIPQFHSAITTKQLDESALYWGWKMLAIMSCMIYNTHRKVAGIKQKWQM